MSRNYSWSQQWSAKALGIVLPLFLLVAACAGGSSTTSLGTGSFTIGTTGLFVTHFIAGRTGDSNLDYAIWTPLTVIEPATGKLVNAIAESFQSTDEKVWTIKLKHGWTFWNGETVTAQSFADSWNTTAYGPNGWFQGFSFNIFEGWTDLNPSSGTPKTKAMSGVKVVDQYTLQVTLTRAFSLLPYLLSGTIFAPLPKEALTDLDAFDKKPIGDGPYEVTGPPYSAGVTSISYKRYDNYAGTKGNAKSFTAKVFQDPTATYTALQGGQIDVALVEGSDVARAASAYPSRFKAVTSPAVVYLGFPLWDKRFNDPAVRQAFSMAIDRQAIVKAILQGYGVAATGFAPASITGGGGSDCTSCTFNPSQAKQLLQAAGGWHGSLSLWTYTDPTNDPVLQAISNQLRTNLGITDISLQSQPVGQIYTNLSGHKVDGPFLLYTGAAYPHVYAMADSLFSIGSFLNTTGYKSQDFGTALAKAASDNSSSAVVQDTHAAGKIALKDLPLAPIFYPQLGLVWSSHVGNVQGEYLGGAHIASITTS